MTFAGACGKTLSLIGLARRAGLLILGVDEVRGALSRGVPLLILVARDVSPVAMEGIRRRGERNGSRILCLPCVRGELGNAAGVRSTTAVALAIQNGFARSILAAHEEGSGADEQGSSL